MVWSVLLVTFLITLQKKRIYQWVIFLVLCPQQRVSAWMRSNINFHSSLIPSLCDSIQEVIISQLSCLPLLSFPFHTFPYPACIFQSPHPILPLLNLTRPWQQLPPFFCLKHKIKPLWRMFPPPFFLTLIDPSSVNHKPIHPEKHLILWHSKDKINYLLPSTDVERMLRSA